MDEIKAELTYANTQLQKKLQGMGHRLMAKSELNKQLDKCISRQCSGLLDKAKATQHAIEARSKSNLQLESAASFMDKKFTTFEETAQVYDANICVESCRRPGMLLKDLEQSSRQALAGHFKACQIDCNSTYGMENSVDKFECLGFCIQSTDKLMNAVEAKIGKDLTENLSF